MSPYTPYMQDRTVELSLSEHERESRIYSFNQMVGLNSLDGEDISKEEEEFALYCVLNDVPLEKMLDVVFTVEGWPLIDHKKAAQNRAAFQKYQERCDNPSFFQRAINRLQKWL